MNNNRRNSKRRTQRKQPKKRVDKKIRYIDVGRFTPDRTFVKFKFNDPSFSRSATGSSVALNFALRSSAYDPDPLLLTGAIPGYAELANMYTHYRVHKMVAKWTVTNPNVNGIMMGVWPSLVLQNQNSLTSADIFEFCGNVGGRMVVTGNNNSPPKTVRVVADAHSLVGPSFMTDDNWASGTSTSPVNMFGINFGSVISVSTFAYPLGSLLEVTYFIEFFARRQLET